jgi:hypothetical protein
MRKQYYYSGDPYWMYAKYAGTCDGCGKRFARDTRVFRFKSGKMFAEECGCGTYESERFEAAAHDEWVGG